MRKATSPSWYTWIIIATFFSILIIPLRKLNFDPHQIESNFYGRERLISWAADFRALIGDRIYPKAIIGEEIWLFLTAEKSIDDYQRVIPLTEDELARIQKNLDAVATDYAEKGINFLIVIPPSKHSIYPEYMPKEISVMGGTSRLDQLLTYLDAHNSPTKILDLRPVLLNAKEEGQQLYYKTDTHWNEYGVLLAYEEITTTLAHENPQVSSHSPSDYQVYVIKNASLDIAQNMGITTFKEDKLGAKPLFQPLANFHEIRAGGRKITFSAIKNEELPSAVVYYDSFFFRMIPLLGEDFSNAIYIQNYLGGGLWNLNWVTENNPDIVIVEFTERYIHDLDILVHR